ncbi:MAG: sigma-70 family RNA polymerase sigma factor [Polyangiaceae bacterium]
MIDRSSRGAWSELDAKLRPFVARRVHASADVDDVLQEVFVRMQRSLPTLRDDERFGPWVYRVARNAVADHHRRVARHPIADDGATAALLEHDGRADRDVTSAEEELSAYVAGFVAMLDTPYREALTLTELEGTSQAEAARLMGVSLSAMKSRVQRGRRRLRALFEACCELDVDVRGRVIACEPRAGGPVADCRCR